MSARATLAGIILIFLFSSDMTAASVVGTYEATSAAELTVKGFFTNFTAEESDDVIVKLLNNKKFRITDDEGFVYAGNYKLVNKGSKVQFKFSKNGQYAIKKMLAIWAKNIAAAKGAVLKMVKLTITDFSTTKAVVTKKGKPKRFFIKIHGTINGILGGKPMAGTFSYISEVKFDEKL
jgi:hypothetical protein